jgi:hypothetical protein
MAASSGLVVVNAHPETGKYLSMMLRCRPNMGAVETTSRKSEIYADYADYADSTALILQASR